MEGKRGKDSGSESTWNQAGPGPVECGRIAGLRARRSAGALAIDVADRSAGAAGGRGSALREWGFRGAPGRRSGVLAWGGARAPTLLRSRRGVVLGCALGPSCRYRSAMVPTSIPTLAPRPETRVSRAWALLVPALTFCPGGALGRPGARRGRPDPGVRERSRSAGRRIQGPLDLDRGVRFVEAPFDSDGDGKNDRLHVDVYRPGATEQGAEGPGDLHDQPLLRWCRPGWGRRDVEPGARTR